VTDSYLSHVLSDENYQRFLKISLDNTKKEYIKELRLPEFIISKIFSNVKEIIERRIVSNVITKLKENPRLNDWVRIGMELHISENTCQFCGNKLPEDLMNRLEHHFTEDLNNLLYDIESMMNTIIQTVEKLENFSDNLPHIYEFYNDYQQPYYELKNKLEQMLETLRDQFNMLLYQLTHKKDNPFQIAEFETDYAAATTIVDYQVESNDLEKVIKEINELIKKHNYRTDQFEKIKQAAKEKLINHHAAQFMIDFDYFKSQKELSDLDAALNNLRERISSILSKIGNIETQLLDAQKGAQRINEYLKTFFQSSRLQIEVEEGGRFILKRNGRIAKNLSEGEKSAISFIYFITKLENRDTNLKETIVVIDDPVSSLDHNHIHSVYAIIKSKLNPKKCKQIFISTHNAEFFNLMKDLSKDIPRFLEKNKNLENSVSYYFLERKYIDDEIVSSIIPLPNELKNYRSEYVFLFVKTD
jgi:wobble nucleotide-excising tRNase